MNVKRNSAKNPTSGKLSTFDYCRVCGGVVTEPAVCTICGARFPKTKVEELFNIRMHPRLAKAILLLLVALSALVLFVSRLWLIVAVPALYFGSIAFSVLMDNARSQFYAWNGDRRSNRPSPMIGTVVTSMACGVKHVSRHPAYLYVELWRNICDRWQVDLGALKPEKKKFFATWTAERKFGYEWQPATPSLVVSWWTWLDRLQVEQHRLREFKALTERSTAISSDPKMLMCKRLHAVQEMVTSTHKTANGCAEVFMDFSKQAAIFLKAMLESTGDCNVAREVERAIEMHMQQASAVNEFILKVFEQGTDEATKGELPALSGIERTVSLWQSLLRLSQVQQERLLVRAIDPLSSLNLRQSLDWSVVNSKLDEESQLEDLDAEYHRLAGQRRVIDDSRLMGLT